MNLTVPSQCVFAALLSTAFLFASGCSNETAVPAKTEGKGEAAHSDDHDHDHSGEHQHASTGPHHGQIIELGREDYHAELVHDESGGSVTIYLLDGNAKNAVAIEALEVVINLKHAGKGTQFKLPAVPQTGDPAGKSSRFASDDKDLNKELDEEGTTARLVIDIEGKSYTGKLEHDHNHGGHDHKH